MNRKALINKLQMRVPVYTEECADEIISEYNELLLMLKTTYEILLDVANDDHDLILKPHQVDVLNKIEEVLKKH